MIDFSEPSIYERVITEGATEQIRLVINTFRVWNICLSENIT